MHSNIPDKKYGTVWCHIFLFLVWDLLAFDVCRETIVETMFFVGCMFFLLNGFPIVFREFREEGIGLGGDVLDFGKA